MWKLITAIKEKIMASEAKTAVNAIDGLLSRTRTLVEDEIKSLETGEDADRGTLEALKNIVTILTMEWKARKDTGTEDTEVPESKFKGEDD